MRELIKKCALVIVVDKVPRVLWRVTPDGTVGDSVTTQCVFPEVHTAYLLGHILRTPNHISKCHKLLHVTFCKKYDHLVGGYRGLDCDDSLPSSL